MDNNTGEMIVTYDIEGNNLKKEKDIFKVAELNNRHFQIINPDSIFYKKEKIWSCF